MLLAHPKVNVNQAETSMGGTPLYVAASTNNVKVVELFLSHPDIDVNLPGAFTGYTPLYLAASRGYLEVIKLFLAMGKDVDLSAKPKSREIKTPMEHAKIRGHFKVYELLKAFKVKTNQYRIKLDLRKEFKLHVQDAGALLALIVLLSDGYLQFQQQKRAKRGKGLLKMIGFLQMNLKLPLELQTRICNLVLEHDSFYMPTKIFDEGLKEVFKYFSKP